MKNPNKNSSGEAGPKTGPLPLLYPLPGSECGTCKGTGMQNLIGCPGAQGECEDCGGCGRDIDGMAEEELDKYLSTFIDDMPAFRERVKAKEVEFAEKYRRMLERNSQNDKEEESRNSERDV